MSISQYNGNLLMFLIDGKTEEVILWLDPAHLSTLLWIHLLCHGTAHEGGHIFRIFEHYNIAMPADFKVSGNVSWLRDRFSKLRRNVKLYIRNRCGQPTFKRPADLFDPRGRRWVGMPVPPNLLDVVEDWDFITRATGVDTPLTPHAVAEFWDEYAPTIAACLNIYNYDLD